MKVCVAMQLTHFDQGDCKSFFAQLHSNASDATIADKLHKVAFQLLQVNQSVH